jgi:hypothetical protein
MGNSLRIAAFLLMLPRSGDEVVAEPAVVDSKSGLS